MFEYSDKVYSQSLEYFSHILIELLSLEYGYAFMLFAQKRIRL
jgi:hypothetical protein